MLQYDISLPFKDYYNIMEPIREYTKDVSETVFGFGHMGNKILSRFYQNEHSSHSSLALKEFREY